LRIFNVKMARLKSAVLALTARHDLEDAIWQRSL
jgi:hypothetical protein